MNPLETTGLGPASRNKTEGNMNANVAQNLTRRKGPCSETVDSIRNRSVSPIVARMIESRVAELHAEGEQREFSRVIAKELRISESAVDRVLTMLLLKHRSDAAILRCGITGALNEATRASKELWEGAA